ncbi:MAG TPA: hypothetical protein VF507_01355 [Pyrinomonadaceae bacterium]|jgi:hypothetical protein
MKTKGFITLATLALASLLFFGMQTGANAQGRGGRGGGGGGGIGGGNPGRGAGGGIGGGELGRPSDRGPGRGGANGGDGAGPGGRRRGNDGNSNSGGPRNGDGPRDPNRLNGIATRLNTTPEALRTAYDTARAANPNLKFGQFIAANVIASNLSASNPNITTAAILAGLNNGRSIGRTLQDLGLSEQQAREAERAARRRAKENR